MWCLVCYFTAADLVEVLYRGRADNTVGQIIDSLLRVDLVIFVRDPLDGTGTQLLFRVVAAGNGRRSLAIASYQPFVQTTGRSFRAVPTQRLAT